jgi:hypothetical protein
VRTTNSVIGRSVTRIFGHRTRDFDKQTYEGKRRWPDWYIAARHFET